MAVFPLEIMVALISFIPPSVGNARVVCISWRSQFEEERRNLNCLRICLDTLARMRSSILRPSDVTGLGPVKLHITGGVSEDVLMQTWMSIARLLRSMLPEMTDATPFGQFTLPLLQGLRKFGRICEKNIHTLEDIDGFLGSHAHWIHFLFEEAVGWEDARGRREVNDLHDQINACRWIMRLLIDTHCFTIINISGEWCTGALLEIGCLFYRPRPACCRPGGRHSFVMATPSGPRDNGELIATCTLCRACF